MTTPVSHRRSREKVMPAKCTGSFGRIGATARGVLVNCITMRAWIASSTPTDATTRARIGARRSGRNTKKCTISPMRLHDSTASTIASAKGTEPHPVAEAHLVRDDRDRKHQVASAVQLIKDVGAPHRHRAGGEVDDAGAAVGDDHAHRDGRVDAAEAEPDDGEQEILLHVVKVDCSARGEAGGGWVQPPRSR